MCCWGPSSGRCGLAEQHGSGQLPAACVVGKSCLASSRRAFAKAPFFFWKSELILMYVLCFPVAWSAGILFIQHWSFEDWRFVELILDLRYRERRQPRDPQNLWSHLASCFVILTHSLRVWPISSSMHFFACFAALHLVSRVSRIRRGFILWKYFEWAKPN